MLTHHRKPVCLSLTSTDLPIETIVETAATLYRKDAERFHLLLKYPIVRENPLRRPASTSVEKVGMGQDGLLWLELSARRVVMTLQGQGQLGYRHFWEQGRYGISRYWLHGDTVDPNGSLRLRNYTHQLQLFGNNLPRRLRLEYELRSANLPLGRYILNLEIQH